MKEFTAVGHYVNVGELKKLLSYQGNSNCEIVCFSIDRYCENVDLSLCNCTIKTSNSAGKSDVILPEIQISEDGIKVFWSVSSASTSVAGKLLAQIQFEKVFDDNTKNIVWQSNIMEFQVQESLHSADEVYDQEPSLFQQWEEKVNTAYSGVATSVDHVQTLESQVQTAADKIAAQEQNILQIQTQVAQKEQDSQSNAQNAQTSASTAQEFSIQAKTSEINALTAENLSKGYSNAANTYSEAAAASTLTAQQQAASAKTDADRAQQTVDGFTGYTKQETSTYFANAFIGEAAGRSIILDDVQPDADFHSLIVSSQTVEVGSGSKSPANPYALSGTAQITVSDGITSAAYALPKALFSLPDGTCDSYDTMSGVLTQQTGRLSLNGSETWLRSTTMPDLANTTAFRATASSSTQSESSISVNSDKFAPVIRYSNTSPSIVTSNIECAAGGNGYIAIRINKSRLTGWSDTWTDAQKIAAFKTWLASNPVTVLYKLSAQSTTQYTKSAIKPFDPYTSIAAASGTITVLYNRDINMFLKKLTDAVKELGGSVN